MKKLYPICNTISDWVAAKCRFLGKPGNFYPELVLIDILIESEDLTWPLSHEFVKLDGKSRYANNLAKVQSNSTWSGKSIEYQESTYKAYKDWLHFAADYSDILCFTDLYDKVLIQPDIESQLTLFSTFKGGAYLIKAQAYLSDLV